MAGVENQPIPQPDRPQHFVGYELRRDYGDGLRLLAAKHIATHRSDISIRPTDQEGDVAIYASDEARMVYGLVLDTSEFRALLTAQGLVHEPSVEDCQWNDDTKHRVRAYYWQQKARSFQHILDRAKQTGMTHDPIGRPTGMRLTINYLLEYDWAIKEAKTRAASLLGVRQPLDRSEFSPMVADIVTRVMQQ